MKHNNERIWYHKHGWRRKRRNPFTPSIVAYNFVYDERKRKKRKRIVLRRFIPACIFAFLFLYGSIRIPIYLFGVWKTQKTNQQLEELYCEYSETASDEDSLTPINYEGSKVINNVALNELIISEEKSILGQIPILSATNAPIEERMYHFIGAEINPSAQKLYNQNSDLIGWLKIPGVVSLPVVYRDNDYYLSHDFYGKKSSSGALLLDESHPFTASTQYMVIHGHNMYDGSMFGLLTHYRKSSYMSEHPIVYFTSLYQKETYRVFGVLVLPTSEEDEHYVAYSGTPCFEDENHFQDFIYQMKDNSLYWDSSNEPNNTDAILSLSTCIGEERVVVICKRIDL